MDVPTFGARLTSPLQVLGLGGASLGMRLLPTDSFCMGEGEDKIPTKPFKGLDLVWSWVRV